jgi:hypothetical protein
VIQTGVRPWELATVCFNKSDCATTLYSQLSSSRAMELTAMRMSIGVNSTIPACPCYAR